MNYIHNDIDYLLVLKLNLMLNNYDFSEAIKELPVFRGVKNTNDSLISFLSNFDLDKYEIKIDEIKYFSR